MKRPVIRANWLNLPDDIVYQIADKLVPYKNYIRFGAVCKLWQKIYFDNIQHYRNLFTRRRFPLLMLPTELNQDDQTRSLYNVLEKTIVNSQVQVARNKHCVGSSYGWLVIVCEDLGVYLLNPFLPSPDNVIRLPSLLTFERRDSDDEVDIIAEPLNRVILSSNPTLNPTKFVVMASYGLSLRLAFWKCGDSVWTQLDTQYKSIFQIFYYQDKVYYFSYAEMNFNLTQYPHLRLPMMLQIELFGLPERVVDGFNIILKYLVEISGDLFLIVRQIKYLVGEEGDYSTFGFVIFKINLAELKFTEVKSLGDHAVFLGLNSPFAVQASSFVGCKPNCIYFTDDFQYGSYNNIQIGIGPHDDGIFSLEDGTITAHYPVKSDMLIPLPVWVEPMPHC